MLFHCLDVGNTNIKWQTIRQDSGKAKPSKIRRCPINNFSVQSPLYKAITQAQFRLICCTSHHPHYHRLHSILKPFPTQWLTAAPKNAGIKIAYEKPQSYGIDRYLSLLTIADQAPLILVDLGSAITIDLMSSNTQHIGGWILPGLTMIKQQFSQYKLSVASRSFTPYQLGRSTPAAIANGYQSMLITFLEHLSVNHQHYGLNNPSLILTGGNASSIAPHLSRQWQNNPHLVLQGLIKYQNTLRTN